MKLESLDSRINLRRSKRINEQKFKIQEKPIINSIITVNRPLAVVLQKEQIKTGFVNRGQKIPRPANAFMIFANENRKKVAKEHPQESNKEISCRLGNQWKNLSTEQKEKYFTMAKTLDAEHKKKYPKILQE